MKLWLAFVFIFELLRVSQASGVFNDCTLRQCNQCRTIISQALASIIRDQDRDNHVTGVQQCPSVKQVSSGSPRSKESRKQARKQA